MDNTTQHQSWLARLFQSVVNFFSGASPAIHDITVIADKVANAVKSSPITSVIETALEAAIPASTGLVEAFKLELPHIVTRLNWAVQEEGKTLDQVVSDGVTYLQSLKGTDQYVIELHGFAATVQKWLSDNLGLGLTIQQALLTPQIVHNPALLGVANEIIGDLKTFSTGVDAVAGATAPKTPFEASGLPKEVQAAPPVDADMQISNEAADNLAGTENAEDVSFIEDQAPGAEGDLNAPPPPAPEAPADIPAQLPPTEQSNVADGAPVAGTQMSYDEAMAAEAEAAKNPQGTTPPPPPPVQ